MLSILVAIAGIGVMNYGDMSPAKQNLTQAEMAEIAHAIRKFKADTGRWPGRTDLDNDTLEDHLDPFDWTILKDIERFGGQWDPSRRRGWDGPYVERALTRDQSADAPPTNLIIVDGKTISITGHFSGIYGDHVIATEDTLIDFFGTPYALLVLNNKNIIVSAGENDEFDELGGKGTSGEYEYNILEPDLDEAEKKERIAKFYKALCSLTHDSDDLIACP